MCGIVGLLLKKPELREQLGELMTPMLVGMTSRGPDSAGVAIFGNAHADCAQAVAVLGRGRRGLEAPRGRAARGVRWQTSLHDQTGQHAVLDDAG